MIGVVGNNRILECLFAKPLKEKKYELAVDEKGVHLNFNKSFNETLGHQEINQKESLSLRPIPSLFRTRLMELRRMSLAAEYAVSPGHKTTLTYHEGKFYERQVEIPNLSMTPQ